jgi:hypothetical protein
MRIVLVAVALSLILAGTPARADYITLTGEDLLGMEGDGVEFPNADPILDGTSLIFESGGTPGSEGFEELIQVVLGGASTFSLTIDFTRLACLGQSCIDGENDSDPRFMIGDGTVFVGVMYTDNGGGNLFADLLNFSDVSVNPSFNTLATGVGYPDIGASALLNLTFTLTDTETTVLASLGESSGSFTWGQSFDLNDLSFYMLHDGDLGERYQLNSLSYPATSVPEPGTLALFAIGLAGMGLARRRARAV